jgi:hypothetical protein
MISTERVLFAMVSSTTVTPEQLAHGASRHPSGCLIIHS